MASRESTVDYLVEQMTGAGVVSARKMFKEYGIWCHGKMVALMCDDQLFVKPTAAGRALAEGVDEVPPHPGAKPCLAIPGERWEDAGWLAALIRTSAAASPAPSRKAKAR